MTLLLIAIMGYALLSLASWWFCWRNVMGGRPHILSMRQITLIMDRERLDTLYGKHKPGYVYELNEAALGQIKRQHRGNMIKEMAADLLCLVGSYNYLMSDEPAGSMLTFAMFAGIYQMLTLWYSFKLVNPYWEQINEEMGGL